LAATYAVQRGTGAGPSWSTVTNVRLHSSDSNVADLTTPVIIDTSVIKRSFWVSICILLGGTFTQVSNLRVYCDGAIGWNFGTLGKLKIGKRDTGDIGVPDASYEQATGSSGDTGDDIDTAHTHYSGQTPPTVDIETYNNLGAAAVVDSTAHTIAERTKHIVVQVETDIDGTQGVQSAETITFAADEI